jgi:hypothetical protein
MNIKIVKLVDGEYIIGDCEGSQVVTIKNPLTLLITGQGAVIMPVLGMISDDKEIQLSGEDILYRVNPSQEVYEHYKKHFSPIEQPNTKLIY